MHLSPIRHQTSGCLLGSLKPFKPSSRPTLTGRHGTAKAQLLNRPEATADLHEALRIDATASASPSGRDTWLDEDSCTLITSCKQLRLPRHIAVIMDGNARWAQQRGMPIFQGHQAGVFALQRIIQWCHALEIPALTVFALSTENWERHETEVNLILRMTERVIGQETNKLFSKGVRVSFIGDRHRLPKSLQTAMIRIEEETRNLSRMHLHVALNYGGTADIANATHQIVHHILSESESEARKYSVSDIEELIRSMTGPYNLPHDLKHPDLLIRTGGEHRLSNFMLLDLAYSELHFCDALWPDMSESNFLEALSDFSKRKRSYGRRPGV